MRKGIMTRLATLFFALTLLPACGGGGGGGPTVNVQPITFNSFVNGDLVTYLSEEWTVTIPNNTFISVELYGVRLDHRTLG